MARYTPNPAGVAAMARAPFMLAEVDRRGALVEAAAVPLTPVRTGRAAASFYRVTGIHDGRARCRVSNRTDYFRFLERGTRYIRAMRILARALMAARD